MNTHIIQSAKRCLNCKKPLCEKGCPIDTPIAKMIQMFLDKEIREAGEILFENNPLSVVCSLICPHERQCEGACILNRKGEPVNISGIENYISDYYLGHVKLVDKSKNGQSIAIIGAGPAGISLAFILAQRGYKVTIYDAHDKIGGVLRYGIPEFRLNKRLLDQITDHLKSLGVKIRPNIMIGKNITIDDLFRDGFKAVFVGTGVWAPKKMGIKGESLGHVHFAIDYLKNPAVYDLGRRVTVIGAGNVAMDVARTAIRHGSQEVKIMYRKGIEEMPARKDEIEFAEIDGVQFDLFKQPVELTDDGVRYIRTEKVRGQQGEYYSHIYGSEAIAEADSILIAISQNPRDLIVNNNKGINVNEKGLVMTDTFGRTTRQGVFSCGDVVTGAKTVVKAVAYAKNVADSIEQFIEDGKWIKS